MSKKKSVFWLLLPHQNKEGAMMDRETVLLNQSIKKWERILQLVKAGEGEKIHDCSSTADGCRMNLKFRLGKSKSHIMLGVSACPLCSGYRDRFGYYLDKCIGCPVMKKTGYRGCLDTPYDEIENIFLDAGFGDDVKVTKRLIKFVEKEVEFLKALREMLDWSLEELEAI